MHAYVRLDEPFTSSSIDDPVGQWESYLVRCRFLGLSVGDPALVSGYALLIPMI